MPRLHLSCGSRRYAANGVRLPKGAAFGRAKIVCKRKKRQKCGFAVFSYLFLSILNSTFYILHFTFADEILRLASLAQDDRGPLLLRITGGRSRVLQDGRAAPCANNFILNFCQTIAKRQNSWYHNTAGACRRAMQ